MLFQFLEKYRDKLIKLIDNFLFKENGFGSIQIKVR